VGWCDDAYVVLGLDALPSRGLRAPQVEVPSSQYARRYLDIKLGKRKAEGGSLGLSPSARLRIREKIDREFER
jgi:hypothetical protein